MEWEIRYHHEEQKMVARNVIAELHPLWGILDFHDLQGTTGDWLRAVRPVIERQYMVSQFLAARFASSYRRSVLPAAEPLNIEVPNPLGAFGTQAPTDRETQLRIMVSMKVTGPVWVAKNSFQGMTEQDQADVMTRGFSKSTGSAIRTALNGGRGMIRLLADSDPMARGVRAVVDEDACDSCHFLETPILKESGSRAMDAVAVGHDFCRCSATLVY